jgi:hypothetical protein
MTTQATTQDEREGQGEAEAVAPIADVKPEARSDEASPGEGLTPTWLVAVAVVLVPAILFLVLPPLSRAGLWDPPELNVADLARRIAVNVFGAGQLALTGTDNAMPHLNDLGKPELPFLSIALGFRLFGLHEWAGRLPLALWGLAGVGATYAFVSRLADRRAGIYAALILATTPLFAVQSRTMIGDVVMMTGFAMAFGGLAVGLLDGVGAARDGDGAGTLASRAAFVAMGVVGLVVGYYSRGTMLGVATPLAAVGLAYAMLVGAGEDARPDAFGHAVGIASLLGVAAVAPSVWGALDHGDRLNMSMTLGGFIKPPAKYPTHDFMLGQIAHAMAPWSAFAPFAVGRLFIATRGRTAKSSAIRAALVIGLATVFVAQGLLLAKVDAVAFVGPALLAATCAIALRDYERGTHASIAVGVGAFLLLFLFRHDLKNLPEKAFQVFGVTAGTFPESFKNQSTVLWAVLLLGFGAVALLTWVERNAKREPFDPSIYLGTLRSLRDAWDGLLSLVYFALVAGASLTGLLVFVGLRMKARWLPTFPKQMSEYLLNAWWIVALAPLLAVFGTLFACDVWVWAFDRAKSPSWGSFTRGFEPFEGLFDRLKKEKDKELRLVELFGLFPLMVLAIPGAVAAGLLLQGVKAPVALALAFPSGIGAFLAIGAVGELLRGSRAAGMIVLGGAFAAGVGGYYYPALANQLSPKEVFESYARVRTTGEPLGLFGVGSRTAAYYAGGQPPSFNDAQGAHDWLVGGDESGRRFLAMRADELGRLNKLYRQGTRANLPVLDARSSQIVLAASRLLPGEKNQNPFDRLILSTNPKPQRPLAANMEDKLEVLGIDLLDEKNKLVDFVTPGRKYNMRTYYRVLAPVTTEWEAFIHIDGYQRRHNGDHKIMQGKYPFSLWLKGDVMVDVYEFSLEPNFSPGNYTIYFGLFLGETRLKVKSGPSDGDNRIIGGALRVQ